MTSPASGQTSLSSQAQAFWIQWVEDAFPDLDSRAYFLPPVYFNRIPMTRRSIFGQDVLVPQTLPRQDGQACPQPVKVQESDIRDDLAMQRVLFCLQRLSEKTKEVFVGISQLQFGQYLGEPCYAAATAQLPSPSRLPPALPRNWKQGDFDVLIIHRHYGLVICEVKAFGDNLKDLRMIQQDIDKNIRKKLEAAVSQLNKSEAMLSHLVSDIAPGLRISKTIAVPNLTRHQVQQAVSDDLQLTQDLLQCLGTKEPADITGLCLCSDQMSDRRTPGDVSCDIVKEMENWWQRRVTEAGPDSHMTCHVYKTLVARFCGPATTVTVPCTCPPRVSVKTLGQAVSWTGECYTAQITLFPEQVDLLNRAPLRLFVTGPPGTGKSVVLLLMGTEWLRCGHDVYIVSTCWESRAACIMLHHMLRQRLEEPLTGAAPGQLHLLQSDQTRDEEVERVVNDLSQAASGGSLYVLADEVGGKFQTFCAKLLTRVPRLHLWAANCFHGYASAGWEVEYLAMPLRSPPVVVREVEQDDFINDRRVHAYSERGVPDHTDGPPVRQLYHRGQGHSGDWPGDCVTCGREVASFLYSLRDSVPVNVPTTVTTGKHTSGSPTPPGLQWRDMLVLHGYGVRDESGMVTGLSEAGIPVQVMTDDDTEDVATAHSDVVWVADGNRVCGLERKVVVCVESRDYYSSRFHLMSRCTAQLVIVCP